NTKVVPTSIYANITYYIEFDIEVNETASNGNYKIAIKGKAYDLDNNTCDLNVPKSVNIKITGEKKAANLKFSNVEYEEEVSRDDEFEIKMTINNTGDLTAKDVKVSLGDLSTQSDIIPQYSSPNKELSDMTTNKPVTVTFPVKIAKKATAGVKTVTATVTWKDAKSSEGYKESTSMFIDIVVPEDEKNAKPNIVISNVTQSPATPTASGTVTLSYVVENKGKTDIKDLKFTPTGLASSGFSPASSEPYIYVDKLQAGKKKKVSIKFNLSKDITEGMHDLAYGFTYKYLNADGTAFEDATETVNLFVLDVKNPKVTENTSIPKLIISDYNTGDKELKAGAIFDFTFDIKNTHASVAAKNIKVTVSSDQNTFSQTEGSNSFYLDEIPAGTTTTETIQLKIKADTASGAYPLKVTFDYEYTGKAAASTDGKSQTDGVAEKTMDEVLNLQVAENARPVVQDISLNSWGENPTVNEQTTLTFNFYNMGKSKLNNVTATVVSDNYQAVDSSTKFIGNVEAGSGNSYEIDLIPLVEGDCPGQLVLTYEDTNGDTVELKNDFTQTIMPAQTMTDPMDPSIPTDAPAVPQAKKAILPTWLFIVIQVVVFIIAIPISRKVVISLYKRKLRKKEDEEL
ncbi:MAG TPA: hypothetical protein VHP81_10235, partial [Lachnospiraceae bacterium]|nr:hypothetical protein [Lachnospiraceae bacterium]